MGGRIIVKVGNKIRLLSGSVKDIDEQFEDMKKRHNAKYGTFYTLDNGTYNRGLRTYDNKITASELKSYDLSNSSGGNFLYLINSSFPTDTIWTPNIRSIKDESYRKGHPIKNEIKGIVLHHTGFTDDDNLEEVTKLLTSPNGNSAHVIIAKDGKRRVLANPEDVTFHAGYSLFNGRDNVNDFMLGIEFQGDTNKEPLTEQQIQSAVEYMIPIIRKYNIPLENITTHKIITDNYNNYLIQQGKTPERSKIDINQRDYTRIIEALKNSIYYKK